MATHFKAPTSNYWSNTLNGAINDSVQTITLTSASGLQAPGVVVINRVNSDGTATAASREVISYTGISSNDLTGCTRGAENSTARSHDDGSIVEAILSTGYWSGVRDSVAAVISTDGADIAVTGTASIATLDVATGTFATLTPTVLSPISTASVVNFNSTDIETITLAVTSIASIAHVQYGALKPATTTDSDGATVTMNFDTSNSHTVVLGGNRTIAFSNFDVGQAGLVRLKQDGTGSRTVTWTPEAAPATIYWAGGTKPTLTTTANKTDTFGFFKSTASTYDGYIVGQNV